MLSCTKVLFLQQVTVNITADDERGSRVIDKHSLQLSFKVGECAIGMSVRCALGWTGEKTLANALAKVSANDLGSSVKVPSERRRGPTLGHPTFLRLR